MDVLTLMIVWVKSIKVLIVFDISKVISLLVKINSEYILVSLNLETF